MSVLLFKFEMGGEKFGQLVGHFLFVRTIDRDGHPVSAGQTKGEHGKNGGGIRDVAVGAFDLHFALVALDCFGDDARRPAVNGLFVCYC